MNARWVVFAFCLLTLDGCVYARLAPRPGAYDVIPGHIFTGQREIHPTYVRPIRERHPGYLVIFCTGDEGWFALGASTALFRHLAEEGYVVAGFNMPEILRPLAHSGHSVSPSRSTEDLKQLYLEARRQLGLSDSTRILMVGFSRGASVVAFTAIRPKLQSYLAGGVAISLTREADYLRVPEDELSANLQIDAHGKLLLYPALKTLSKTPVAVIQSSRDKYITAAESRQLLGPDTALLRLYTIEATNHSFQGARDLLLHDLDDAMRWVEGPNLTSDKEP